MYKRNKISIAELNNEIIQELEINSCLEFASKMKQMPFYSQSEPHYPVVAFIYICVCLVKSDIDEVEYLPESVSPLQEAGLVDCGSKEGYYRLTAMVTDELLSYDKSKLVYDYKRINHETLLDIIDFNGASMRRPIIHLDVDFLNNFKHKEIGVCHYKGLSNSDLEWFNFCPPDDWFDVDYFAIYILTPHKSTLKFSVVSEIMKNIETPYMIHYEGKPRPQRPIAWGVTESYESSNTEIYVFSV